MNPLIKLFLIGILSTSIIQADNFEIDSVGFNIGYAKMFYKQEDKKNPPSMKIDPNDNFLNIEAYTTFTLFNIRTIKPTINYILNVNSQLTNHTILLGVNKYFNFENSNLYVGLLGGAGMLKWDYNPLSNTTTNDYTNTSFVGGLQTGVEYHLGEKLLFNVNLKYLMHDYEMQLIPSTLVHSTINHTSTASISLGLRFLFAKTQPKEIEPEPEVDSDGDGVYDSDDRCPNTPEGSIIDDKGCILDLSITMVDIRERSNNATPIISGTLNPIAQSVSVEIKDRNNILDVLGFSTLGKNASLDKKGNWSVAIPRLQDGQYTAVAIANYGDIYDSTRVEKNFEVDTTGPRVTMSNIADFSQEVSPKIYGDIGPDAVYATVEIQDINGTTIEIKEAEFDENGNWSVETSTLLDGNYTAVITAIDDLENSSIATEDGFEINTGVFTLNIIFEKMSFVIREEYEEDIEKFATYLIKFPTYKTEIKAYTCNSGSKRYNLRLSKKRARAVYNKLIELGINPKRMSYEGYGEKFPKVSNDTEKGRAQNRRIEAVVIKNTTAKVDDGFDVDTGVFTLNIKFDKMSYVVKEEYEDGIRKFADYLIKFPTYKTEIKAYTCNSGSKRYNLKLSKSRARAVYLKLVEFGIDSKRMSYKGFGEKYPKASNKTKEGRAKNRRIEAVIIKDEKWARDKYR